MSSTPPPPPIGFPESSATVPGSFDRRTLKAQRRAALQQAQFQRAQLRIQMRAARRRSVVGPLLLLLLGTILLLLQLGRLHWEPVLLALGRWWPAILLIAGLVMLGEWALDRRDRSTAGASFAPVRTLGGGTVALLIGLAFVGAGMMAAENSSMWARGNLDQEFVNRNFGDWRQLFGARSEFTQELHAPLSAAGGLVVRNPRGDITVTGSSQDGQVHVTAHQHLFAWQGRDLDERQRAEQIHFSGDSSHLVLIAASQNQDDADLTIELPHEAPLTIRSDHGDINVEELRGAVEIHASDGDVKLTALRGPVHLSTEDDNADVTVHSLSGGFTLDGRTGDITLSDVDGPVTLHGDFFGTTHLERIRGPVRFQSSFTDFSCVSIPGDLNVEGRSDFEAHRLQGPVVLATTNRNLSLDGVRGGATVTDRNGSIDLKLVGPLQPLQVTNQDGSIDVSVPGDQGFTVSAQTSNGDIQNDFGLSSEKSGDRSNLQGRNKGGGPTLTVSTTEGDLNLHRTSGANPADWDDDGQRITPAPKVPKAKKKDSQPAPPA